MHEHERTSSDKITATNGLKEHGPPTGPTTRHDVADLNLGAVGAVAARRSQGNNNARNGRYNRKRQTFRLRRHLLMAAVCWLLIVPSNASGEDQPLWEAGLGFTVLNFPDYRGSDERTTYVLPVPYAIYRGKLLRVERDRARGIFFEKRRISLQLSVSGSVPVDSSGNAARSGMPDLDPTFEIGPSVDLLLYENATADFKIDLRLPLRTVIATDLRHFDNVGWVFEPRINFNWRNVLAGRQWNSGIAAGPVFGDKRYHNYFYGVAPEFATAQRPAYVAESGYGGTQVTATVSRRYGRMWVGAFVRWDSVFEAVFDASPLVRQEETMTAGMAAVWRLNESKRRVPEQY